MKRSTIAWYGVSLIISLMFVGVFIQSAKMGELRRQEREENKWFVGDTKKGITLVSITNNFWGDEPTFECEGKIIDINVAGTSLFPNGIILTVIEAVSNGGYVIVEFK